MRKPLRSLVAPILAMAGLASLAACASSTPYASVGEGSGYGFAEQRIENNRYRVTFRGNSLTSREQVENYLLYRAAELTLQNGYDYFLVVKDETDKSTDYRSVGRPDYLYYGRGRAFPYYGYGWGWGPDELDIRETTRYSAIAYILMGEGQKPNDPAAYDAVQVEANLSPVIERTPQ